MLVQYTKRLYIFIFLLLIAAVFTTQTESMAEYDARYFQKAEALSELGIFKGTEHGFELERKPTRLEGAVMLVRLLGKENLAFEKKHSHPFTDVPVWADPYIGYLYETELTKGKSAEQFGSSDSMTSLEYITFVLRALGYDDAAGDFTWNTSVAKAIQINLLTRDEGLLLMQNSMLRDDVANISYKALRLKLNNEDETLLNKLIVEEVFSNEAVLRFNTYFDPAFSSQFIGLLDIHSLDQDWGKDMQMIIQTETNRLAVQLDDALSYEIKTKYDPIYKIYEFNDSDQLESVSFIAQKKFYKNLNYDKEYLLIKEHFTERYGRAYFDDPPDSAELKYNSIWILHGIDIGLNVNKSDDMIQIIFTGSEGNSLLRENKNKNKNKNKNNNNNNKPFHYTSPNKDFRNVNWGASLQEVLELEDAVLFNKEDDSLVYIVKDSQVDYVLNYIFEDNKLIKSTYLIHGEQLNNINLIDHYDMLNELLTNLYGESSMEIIDKLNSATIKTWDDSSLHISLMLISDNSISIIFKNTDRG